MPWKSMGEVPPNLRKLKGARLTLEQANAIARCAEELQKEPGSREPWAICISAFLKSHKIQKGRWVRKEK